ncbi:MAG TPA: MFS transporter [Methylomirabilota bacterium]|nr:MFS transporter [Methylomirabilota bacterium]
MTRRWVVVAALFAVTSSVSTSLTAFGVFLPELSQTFGWSRGGVSVALTINLIVGGLAAFPVGWRADRHGPRGVLALTVLTGAVGFALSSGISRLWHFYLSYGLLVGLGVSSIYVLAAATVSRWFHERRGLALAVVLSGFNLGWLVGGPLAAYLIGVGGWRFAYLAFAVLIAGVGVPASLCVRYPPGPGAARPGAAGASDALGDRRLWYLVGAWALLGLVFMMVAVHSVPFARDRGFPLERASLVLTAFGVGAAIGRLLAGVASDRIGAGPTMRACVLIQGIALVALVLQPPGWALPFILLAFGVGASGTDNTFVKVVPDVFGLAALATIMSVLGMGWRSGAGLGPAAAGFVYDLTHSYTASFAGGLAALTVGWTLFRLGSARPLHGRTPGNS